MVWYQINENKLFKEERYCKMYVYPYHTMLMTYFKEIVLVFLRVFKVKGLITND